MNVQSFVVYGLVIIFFIAIATLVPFVLVRSEVQHGDLAEKTPEKASPTKTSIVAYCLTAVLFVLFIAMTFMTQKGHSHMTS